MLFPIPSVDLTFWLGLFGSGVLNLTATIMSTRSLKLDDASLVAPLLTLNPLFTVLVASFTLGEVPSPWGALGVLLILAGGFTLNIEEISGGWWRTFFYASAT